MGTVDPRKNLPLVRRSRHVQAVNDYAYPHVLERVVVERPRQGEAGSFAELVRRHDSQLRALVHRLIQGDGDADDIMQDAYLKAFRALPRFRGASSLATWLYRITYNVCMDHLRRRQVRPVQSIEEESEQAWTGPDPADLALTRQALGQALAGLSTGHRAVVLLIDGDGLDYAEAAARLGLPVGTVASRLNRARADLRRVLEPVAPEAA